MLYVNVTLLKIRSVVVSIFRADAPPRKNPLNIESRMLTVVTVKRLIVVNPETSLKS